MERRIIIPAIGFTMLIGILCAWAEGKAPMSPTPPSVDAGLVVQTVAEGREHPWAFAFLPDGRMLVTERPGRLRLVTSDGTVSEPLAGVPAVFATGQGGLLDVKIDPHFNDNHFVYLSYAEPGENGTAGTAVARGRLIDRGLDSVGVLYRQHPKVGGGNHFGSRLAFMRDGTSLSRRGIVTSIEHKRKI